MTTRILVAEDDHKQAQLVRRYLELDGHTVLVVHDGRAAIDAARQRRPDLLVLDVMMPGVDGLDVCRIIRAESDVPIVLLTARSTENDVLLGFDLGADDYVTKPYRPRELAARVRTVLRRRRPPEPGPDEEALRVGDLVIDVARHRVHRGGHLVDCTPTEFRLLRVLAAAPGRVFTRQQLLDGASGFDGYALERTVDVHVRNLRRKLGDDPSAPTLLRTVYGVGYQLADPDDPLDDAGAGPARGPATGG